MDSFHRRIDATCRTKARIVAQLSLAFKPRKSPHPSSDLVTRKPGNNRIHNNATTIVPAHPISTAGTAPNSRAVILDLPTDCHRHHLERNR
jgi:hypothetical protein